MPNTHTQDRTHAGAISHARADDLSQPTQQFDDSEARTSLQMIFHSEVPCGGAGASGLCPSKGGEGHYDGKKRCLSQRSPPPASRVSSQPTAAASIVGQDGEECGLAAGRETPMLTQAQRQRIERNRRAAVQRRREREGQRGHGCGCSADTNSQDVGAAEADGGVTSGVAEVEMRTAASRATASQCCGRQAAGAQIVSMRASPSALRTAAHPPSAPSAGDPFHSIPFQSNLVESYRIFACVPPTAISCNASRGAGSCALDTHVSCREGLLRPCGEVVDDHAGLTVPSHATQCASTLGVGKNTADAHAISQGCLRVTPTFPLTSAPDEERDDLISLHRGAPPVHSSTKTRARQCVVAASTSSLSPAPGLVSEEGCRQRRLERGESPGALRNCNRDSNDGQALIGHELTRDQVERIARNRTEALARRGRRT